MLFTSSTISAASSSVASLTVSCAAYQTKAIQIVQRMITALTSTTCLTVELGVSCDIIKANYCLGESIQFLRTAAVEDEMVCRYPNT